MPRIKATAGKTCTRLSFDGENGPTLEDMKTEACNPLPSLPLGSKNGKIGSDGVWRKVVKDGGCQTLYLERYPSQEPIRYLTYEYIQGRNGNKKIVTKIAVYSSDGLDDFSPQRRSPKKKFRGCTRSLIPGRRPKHRYRPGTVALRSIRKYQGHNENVIDPYADQNRKKIFFGQDATRLLIPKLSFQHVVREILCEMKSDARITVDALKALQTAAESHLVSVFMDSNILALHARRETLQKEDIRNAIRIRRDPCWYISETSEKTDRFAKRGYEFPRRVDGEPDRRGAGFF